MLGKILFEDTPDNSIFDASRLLDEMTHMETRDQFSRPLLFARQPKQKQFISAIDNPILDTLIPALPPPTTDLYIIANGNGGSIKEQENKQVAFEFGHLVAHLTRLLNARGCTCYISTWSMNRDHALMLLDLLDTGAFSTLSMLCDPSFRGRKSAIYNTLVSGIRERGQRFKMLLNHAKVMLIAAPNESQTITVFGSANLSSLPRAENFTLSTDPAFYRFCRDEFFEAVFSG